MASRMTPVTTMAARGVRRTGSMRAICNGSQRSRAMEKATRDEARMVALRADMVDSRPPSTMTATPKAGMNCSAARTIAVSPYCPRKAHDGMPSGLIGAERHEQDQQVDGHRDGERDEGGAGDRPLGVLDLLGHGGDQVVALEGDEGQPHGHHDPAETHGKEGREAVNRLSGIGEDPLQPVGDEDDQYDDLGHGQRVLGLAGDLGAANVEAEEHDAHQHRHHQQRKVLSGRTEQAGGEAWEVLVEDLPEVPRESQRVQTAGHGVGEPQHPA